MTEAGSSFGHKYTEITKMKMKTNYSLARKLFIGNLNKSQNLTRETIEKIRASSLNRKKVIFSDQAKLNLKKKSKTIILYNLDLTVYREFKSITDAAKAIGCSTKTIYRALNSKQKLLIKQFIVKFKNN